MLEESVLLRKVEKDTIGVFVLLKSVLLNEGSNTPSTSLQRCDNLSYAGVLPTVGTEYEHEGHSLYRPSQYSGKEFNVKKITRYELPIVAHPNFCIGYIEAESGIKTETDFTPSSMWMPRSIWHLLKVMREWSLISEEPFNSNHPMTTYSQLFFETTNPPQEIIDEIDSWPDMHLAMFLKGNSEYKKIPYNFPDPSGEITQWVLGLTEAYKNKSFEEMIEGL